MNVTLKPDPVPSLPVRAQTSGRSSGWISLFAAGMAKNSWATGLQWEHAKARRAGDFPLPGFPLGVCACKRLQPVLPGRLRRAGCMRFRVLRRLRGSCNSCHSPPQFFQPGRSRRIFKCGRRISVSCCRDLETSSDKQLIGSSQLFFKPIGLHMKSKLLKLSAGIGLLGISAAAFASAGCCGDLQCCLEMLACCF